MPQGITATINDLIQLRRHITTAQSKVARSHSTSASASSHVKGRGMAFAEARNYQAGDEIRHMDWKITARTGKPHIKLYQEERERPVILIADFNPSMFFGTKIAFKSWVAAQLAALITWTSIQQKNRIGGIIFSAQQHQELQPSAKEKAALPLLSALSQYTYLWEKYLDYPENRPLSQILLRLYRVVKPGSLLIFISDFFNLDNECAPHFSRLTEHNDILCFHINDPLEITPPQGNRYAFTHSNQTIWLDTRDNCTQKFYAELLKQRQQEIKNLCLSKKMTYIPTTAESHLPMLVQQHLSRKFYA